MLKNNGLHQIRTYTNKTLMYHAGYQKIIKTKHFILIKGSNGIQNKDFMKKNIYWNNKKLII